MKSCLVFCCDRNFKIGLDKAYSSILKHNSFINGIDKILITDDINDYQDFKIIKIDKNIYSGIDYPRRSSQRFIKTFYKLEAFNIKGYDRMVLTDSDILCLGDISYLFSKDLEEFDISMANDIGIGKSKKHNTGVMVINKNLTDTDKYYKYLLDIAKRGLSKDGGDQGCIQYMLPALNINVGTLPIIYNTLKRVYTHQKDMWKEIEKDIRILHFVGEKPWSNKKDKFGDYSKLNDIWLHE